MTPPTDYSKIYTHAPEQHPNLILGSLQLLFWFFFRPSAWLNHFKCIDPNLDPYSNQRYRLQWLNSDLWALLIQGYLVLPFLTNLILGFVLWRLGESVEKTVFAVVISVATGVATGVAASVVLGIAFGMALSVVVGVATGIAISVASGVMFGIMFSVALTINLWRPVVLYPLLLVWNTLIYQLDKGRRDSKRSLLPWNSTFWDELQSLPLIGLDKHLLLVMERNLGEGKAAIDYLTDSRQRWAVQAAQIKLEKRAKTNDNRQQIDNTYVTSVPGNDQLQIITRHTTITTLTDKWQETDNNPYIIGLPLNDQVEIFIGRTDMGTRIEQLLLDRRRPSLLLYGQRRMGKTSLLYNLGRLLPNTIIPMFVDLQGAASSAKDYAGFLYNLAKAMKKSAERQAITLPSLPRRMLQTDPSTYFDEWLDKVEQSLRENRALLALDEFEVLDSAINKGRFDELDVLGMLRHLIQHRPRFKVLLAGSHTIEEYHRWASYLINVQVVHISYLQEDEARQLIERPVKDFALQYDPGAVERVLQLTRCHPFLVQLLCSEIVALKNEQDLSVRRRVTLVDVQASVPNALSAGRLFFADIQNNQVDAAGLRILRLLAAKGEGSTVSRKAILQKFPDGTENALKLLLQRELIEEVEDDHKFQVELIRRWFDQ